MRELARLQGVWDPAAGSYAGAEARIAAMTPEERVRFVRQVEEEIHAALMKEYPENHRHTGKPI